MKTLQHNQKSLIVNGDLFEYVKSYIRQGNNGFSIIVPHVCNNVNAFGAGFAAGVQSHYPQVKENYHLLGKNFLRNNLGYTQFVEVEKDKTFGHRLIFANMIAQNGLINEMNKRPLNYFALCKSMSTVKKYILDNFDKDSKVQIHAPKFGAGLAGGDWKLINYLIEDIWSNFDVFIYNYYPHNFNQK
jgi:hypothetical protein